MRAIATETYAKYALPETRADGRDSRESVNRKPSLKSVFRPFEKSAPAAGSSKGTGMRRAAMIVDFMRSPLNPTGDTLEVRLVGFTR